MNHTTPHHTTKEPELIETCIYCDEPGTIPFNTSSGYDYTCEDHESWYYESSFYCETCNMYHSRDNGYFTNYRVYQYDIYCIDCIKTMMLSDDLIITVDDMEMEPFYFLEFQLSLEELNKYGFINSEISREITSKEDLKELFSEFKKQNNPDCSIILRNESFNPYWDNATIKIYYKEPQK